MPHYFSSFAKLMCLLTGLFMSLLLAPVAFANDNYDSNPLVTENKLTAPATEMPADTQEGNADAQARYEKAALQGNIDAQIALAKMYQTGDGIAKDDKLAFAWFYVVVSGRDPKADQYGQEISRYMGQLDDQSIIDAVKLGNQHLRSISGKDLAGFNPYAALSMKYARSDPAKAYKYMLTAAREGDPQSQLRVSSMYFHGQGTKVDKQRAYAWIALLASKEQDAIKMRDKMAAEFDSESLAEAKKLAEELINTYGQKR